MQQDCISWKVHYFVMCKINQCFCNEGFLSWLFYSFFFALNWTTFTWKSLPWSVANQQLLHTTMCSNIKLQRAFTIYVSIKIVWNKMTSLNCHITLPYTALLLLLLPFLCNAKWCSAVPEQCRADVHREKYFRSVRLWFQSNMSLFRTFMVGAWS